jgi:hypothetical protein
MQRNLTILLFMLLSSVTCFSQTTFLGLTPGKSTRAEVERVLGQPVKSPSGTLFEYKGTTGVSKIYVQYSDESPPVALRIELLCDMKPTVQPGCFPKSNSGRADMLDIRLEARVDAIIRTSSGESNSSIVQYFGSPDFFVHSNVTRPGNVQYRAGFYSKELYENAVPKGGCTGLWYGVWDTNRGRMVLSSTNDPGENITSGGKFSKAGTVTGSFGAGRIWLTGEWKDETGAGTMELDLSNHIDDTRKDSFTGTWKRTSGKGEREGTWEGRCVETN